MKIKQFKVGNIVYAIDYRWTHKSVIGVVTKVLEDGYEVLSINYRSLHNKRPKWIASTVTIDSKEPKLRDNIYHLTKRCTLNYQELGILFGYDSTVQLVTQLERKSELPTKYVNREYLKEFHPFTKLKLYPVNYRVSLDNLGVKLKDKLEYTNLTKEQAKTPKFTKYPMGHDKVYDGLSYDSFYQLLIIASHFALMGKAEEMMSKVEVIKSVNTNYRVPKHIANKRARTEGEIF